MPPQSAKIDPHGLVGEIRLDRGENSQEVLTNESRACLDAKRKNRPPRARPVGESGQTEGESNSQEVLTTKYANGANKIGKGWPSRLDAKRKKRPPRARPVGESGQTEGEGNSQEVLTTKYANGANMIRKGLAKPPRRKAQK